MRRGLAVITTAYFRTPSTVGRPPYGRPRKDSFVGEVEGALHPPRVLPTSNGAKGRMVLPVSHPPTYRTKSRSETKGRSPICGPTVPMRLPPRGKSTERRAIPTRGKDKRQRPFQGIQQGPPYTPSKRTPRCKCERPKNNHLPPFLPPSNLRPSGEGEQRVGHSYPIFSCTTPATNSPSGPRQGNS